MGFVSLGSHNPYLKSDEAPASTSNGISRFLGRWQLTLLFVATALVALSVSGVVVNYIASELAIGNLIRSVEADASQRASHVEFSLRNNLHVHRQPPNQTPPTDDSLQRVGSLAQSPPLTLDYLKSTEGLPKVFLAEARDLNIEKFNLFDLSGTVIWSSDPDSIGKTNHESLLFQRANRGETGSHLELEKTLVDLDGRVATLDIVETYLPLRDTPSGEIIGVMEVYKDAGGEFILQATHTRTTIFRTTLVSMGFLFLILSGFIVVADLIIHRSKKRQLLLSTEVQRTLEDRIQVRTSELEKARNGLETLVTERTSELRAAIEHMEASNELLLAEIDERRELQEQLIQSQKLESIGQLAGGVAHDFNNLLSVITGYTSMLLSKNATGSEDSGHLLEIAKAAERGTQLTSQLLGFSRRQVIKPIVMDLSDAILNSYEMLRRVIGENIELVMSPAEELPAVFMDPNQLDQIIINLVVNARDAMPEGGTLTVAVNHSQGELSAGHIANCVVLSVSDTGVGMSEEVKAHLFEPFFTTKETGHGTGLGLATCYGIVEQNGGHIEVDSEVGQGSTFRVYLPITEGRRGSDLNDVGTIKVSRPTPGTETTLLVEDEPAVRAMEANILADQGYTILQAGDGEEALQVCQANQDREIQLLVTDMVMPRMSGDELITELSSRRPQTKFLVVSGYAKSALERNVLTRGDVRFMQKPFKPLELANTVREILDGVPEPVV